MSESVPLLILVLALATGLVAAIVVAQRTHGSHADFHRYFLTNILFFNLLILSGMVFSFLRSPTVGGPDLHPFVLPLTLAVMAVLKVGWLYAFTLCLRVLVHGRCPEDLSRTLRTAGLTILATYLLVTWLSWFLSLQGLLQVAVIVMELIIVIGALIGSLKLVMAASQLPKASRRRSLLLFGYFHLGLLGIVLVILVSGWIQPGPQQPPQLMANGGFLLLFNLFPPVWIKLFQPVQRATDVEKYDSMGITQRERGVIELIKAGKTNQEIADQLHISVATVKDHNHNLFRKCGVRNRLELVNLFR